MVAHMVPIFTYFKREQLTINKPFASTLLNLSCREEDAPFAVARFRNNEGEEVKWQLQVR
jgi:hypothetical protein